MIPTTAQPGSAAEPIKVVEVTKIAVAEVPAQTPTFTDPLAAAAAAVWKRHRLEQAALAELVAAGMPADDPNAPELVARVIANYDTHTQS